ncbi:L-threonylcarbamoyladenylate synthase [Paeniglutamicibacter sulfureus]|uniref:L-threonylcarbamoyladenylate synthase n=1 Tax=Paeniglutamicibacter sulfureus TaxID=43666 RepID=A0ABU2BNI2_9MICC|nr:tRNA threonylcarbamoyl adenosine modification protein (Sua5/YciO/YrdC/YwlC family) [Paeniglutamicibacter sulfureus]
MTSRFDARDSQQLEAGLEAARDALAQNRCIVMPTDTVYGIAADAFSAQAVATLLAAKGRGRNMPPPVLIPQAATMDGLAIDIPAFARDLAAEFWPGALTLILHAQPSLTWDLGETRGTVALRMPDDEVARQLLRSTGPLAVSSANRTGHPAAATAEAAFGQLGETVEVYLEAGARPIAGEALSSTIVDCTLTPPRVVRAGAISVEALRVVVPDLLDTDGQPDPALTVDAAPSSDESGAGFAQAEADVNDTAAEALPASDDFLLPDANSDNTDANADTDANSDNTDADADTDANSDNTDADADADTDADADADTDADADADIASGPATTHSDAKSGTAPGVTPVETQNRGGTESGDAAGESARTP